MPPWTGRAVRVVLTAALVGAALFGAARAYAWSALDAPLETAMDDLAFVEDARVRRGDVVRLELRLRSVDHLREAYLQAERAARVANPRADVELTLHDRRTPKLVDDFYRLRPLVLEAAAGGRYTGMSERFARQAERLGLDERSAFTVDHRHVYIQLHRGSRYLYAVEPRPHRAPTGAEGP